MSDEYDRAIQIGLANENLISLGKAWCTHIRTDRSGFGIGILEEATGLPITGGRFACDYARHSGGIAGMQLEVSALGFYESNCVGCPHRQPGNRVPNLGTWAEPLIAARDREEHAATQAREQLVAERETRALQRRVIAAALSAADQAVVDLVNRLDLDPCDGEAGELLRASAQLAPETFGTEVQQMLHADARLLHSPLLLDTLLVLAAGADSPALHSLCLDAIQAGWGRSEACQHLAAHGTTTDINPDVLEAIVFEAAPSGWLGHRTRGHPAALLHFHQLARDEVESKLREMLRHGESWVRAAGAAATKIVLAPDKSAGLRLLSALLDGLRHREDRYSHDEASAEIAETVAQILLKDPGAVESAVNSRWPGATGEYRYRLMGCFDAVVRRRTDDLPADVARVVLARAVSALAGPMPDHHQAFDDDFQHRAAGLLDMAVARSPSEVISLDVLVGLLLTWLERERAGRTDEPTDMRAALERMGNQARMSGLVRDIADAVTVAGHRDPERFIVVCDDLYRGTEPTPSVRAELVRLAGRVATNSDATMSAALPLIYTAMLGDDQEVRAAGLEAAAQLLRALPDESIPPLLAQTMVAGLADQYLIVVTAAVKAARLVPADLIDHRTTALQLLLAARAYAYDRLRDQLVEDAISAAYRLCRDDDGWRGTIRLAALEIVRLMPAFNAREVLSRYTWLDEAPLWPEVAIHTLRADEDPQYETLRDDDKERLLARLGRHHLSNEQIEALVTVESQAARFDHRRALQAADVLSELGRPDKAALVLRALVDSVPSTIEQGRFRRRCELALLVHETEAAIRDGDESRQACIGERVEELREPE